MYILIVDDNPDMRDILSINLKQFDLEIRTAQNGQEALTLIEEELPGAILLDLMMPVMDGFTLLGLLNRRGLTDQVPVIVLSAVAKNMSGARLRGARATLQKGRVNAEMLQDALTAAGLTLQA